MGKQSTSSAFFAKGKQPALVLCFISFLFYFLLAHLVFLQGVIILDDIDRIAEMIQVSSGEVGVHLVLRMLICFGGFFFNVAEKKLHQASFSQPILHALLSLLQHSGMPSSRLLVLATMSTPGASARLPTAARHALRLDALFPVQFGLRRLDSAAIARVLAHFNVFVEDPPHPAQIDGHVRRLYPGSLAIKDVIRTSLYLRFQNMRCPPADNTCAVDSGKGRVTVNEDRLAAAIHLHSAEAMIED